MEYKINTKSILFCVFLIIFIEASKCCLHIVNDCSIENIVLFTETTIENCRAKKEIRDTTKKKSSKFDKIELPEIIDKTTGYHPSCYKSYCAVSFKKTDSSSSLMSIGSERSEIDEISFAEFSVVLEHELDVAGASGLESDHPMDSKLMLSKHRNL